MNEFIQRILDEIAADARLTASYTGRRQLHARVMAAIAEVERDKFVPPEYRAAAWENRPLPIGHEQTISQPFIVALMTDLLELEPGHSVLEIGTGSGYQAAILSLLAGQVFTIERVPALAASARDRLRELGYANVQVRCDDGSRGWPEAGPFDAIIVTAAAEEIPAPLVDQLKPGGRMVIPVGPRYGRQELLLVMRRVDGETETRNVLGVAFVPLVRDRPADSGG